MSLPDSPLERLREVLKKESTLSGLVVSDRFELGQRVARGGMADVYRAYDRQLKRYVAVKFLREIAERDVLRFIEETQTQAALNHPNIVTVHERGSAFGMAYVAMQLIEGSSLDGRTLSMDEAVSLLEPVAEAVDYAHRHGVVHGDIKPANILVSADRHVYLTDFGLAPRVQDRVFGTPEYMSPEHARRQEPVGPPSDVYMLGATLYALLSGSAPFHGRSTDEILRKIAESHPPPIGAAAVDAVIRKAMARNPQDRYASAQAFAEELRRLGLDESIVALRRPLVSRVIRRARRNRILVMAVIGFVVAAALGLKYILDMNHERRRTLAEHRLAESYRVLHEKGRLEDALALLDQSIESHALASAYLLRGHLRLRNGQGAAAMEDFARALGLQAYLEGRLQEALTKLSDSDELSLLLREVCKKKLGQKADFEAYLKLHPEERAGIESLSR